MRVASAVTAVFGFALAATLSAEDKVARGKQVFEEKKCRMCHSLGGVGNAKGSPLDAVGSKHGPDALKLWLIQPKEMAQKAGSTRKPPMSSFATLPPMDLDALVAYLSTLKKAGQ